MSAHSRSWSFRSLRTFPNLDALRESGVSDDPGRELYLDLLQRVLTRLLFDKAYKIYLPKRKRRLRRALAQGLQRILSRNELQLMRVIPLDHMRRELGTDHPVDAETMVGLIRLENLRTCISDVIEHRVPGDLIETGVWRGGASIFMRAVLRAYGDESRTVWVADSFQGLPRPNAEKYPQDAEDKHWTIERLAISVEEVRANFQRYGLLDDRVRFLVGWFSETLPDAPIKQLAVLRLDGDMYESTMDALQALYPKLSVGGYVIIDDFFLPGCEAAVHDYRSKYRITDKIEPIDKWSAFWQRQS